MNSIFSTALTILIALDPAGNLPVFISLLRKQKTEDFRRIIVQQSLIAFAILLFFLTFGRKTLQLLQVSEVSIELSGGVILFIIALKMIFGAPILHQEKEDDEKHLGIVPLAIPLLAGPSAVATVILIGSSQPLYIGSVALMTAWICSTVILLAGRYLERFFGPKVLEAVEAMMGIVLAIVSVEMLINGIRTVFK